MAAISRSLRTVRSSSSSLLHTVRSFSLSKHPLPSSSSSSAHHYLSKFLRPNDQLPRSVRPVFHGLARMNQVRFNGGSGSGRSWPPANSSGSNFSDRPPTEMAPLFPGCDYNHWLIVMDKPGGEGATKQQMLDCYVQTLAKVLGSEEESKQKIYNVSCERYFGFGCEIDEETSNKLEGLPGVLFVLPDSYVDAEFKDYGGMHIWKAYQY